MPKLAKQNTITLNLEDFFQERVDLCEETYREFLPIEQTTQNNKWPASVAWPFM